MCEIVNDIIEQTKLYMNCKHKLPSQICLSKREYIAYKRELSLKGTIYFEHNGVRHMLPLCILL